MKRKILAFGLVLSMTGMALSGCGNTAVKTESDKVVIETTAEETVQESEVEENKETADAGEADSTEETDAGEEAAETEVPTETEEPEPADWLEEHGIAITPQGDCQVTFEGYTKNGDEQIPAGDFMADVNVSISETTEGVEEGFKKVSALFSMDASSNPGSGYNYWAYAFDRYTGTSFLFDDSVEYPSVGDHEAKKGFMTIQNGDMYYDVAISFEDNDDQYPNVYRTITVTCPIDYDGVVFQIGYSSPKLLEQWEEPIEKLSYTIDELPYYGDGHLYFTMTND